MLVYIIGYAMVYSGDIKRMQDRGNAAITRIREWSRSLTCTESELVRAISSDIEGKPHVAEGTESESGFNALAQICFARLGGTPEVYEYQMSIRYVSQLVEQTSKLNTAAGREHTQDSRVRGLRRLALKVEEIRMRDSKNPDALQKGEDVIFKNQEKDVNSL